MTSPGVIHGPKVPTALQRRRRRIVALFGVLALIAVAALLTPEVIGGRSGDERLTTYSADAQGARLLYELAQRLGWHAERWTAGPEVPADARTVVAILDPVVPLGAIETHNLLERVRAGAALVYVLSGSSPLNDSLHVKRSLFGGNYQGTAAGTADVPRAATGGNGVRARRFDSDTNASAVDDDESERSTECAGASPNGGGLPMWPDQIVHLWRFQWTRPRPAGAVIFARSVADREARDTPGVRTELAAAGFPLGAGRVTVLSDPDFLRNDVLRVCSFGLDVVATRILEYVAAGNPPRNRLVFDEYHQGYGPHPGTLRAIVAFLLHIPSGHLLLQAMLGGLVLLLALGPRALPPHDTERVERRSPLEHVGALAQAYARVGATRTATTRLLRGVRRRVERNAGRTRAGSDAESDARFLDAAEGAPDRKADVALIRRGLETAMSRREFEAVGGALQRLEESLLAERR